MDNVKTGKYIREQRIKNSLTQKELAERLDVEPQTVSKWERGMGVPDTSLLVPLAKIFNVTVVKVNTVNVKPKPKRVRYQKGYTRSWKKAIVKLAEGDSIDLYSN